MAKYTWRKSQSEIRKVIAFGMTLKELLVLLMAVVVGALSYLLLAPIVGKDVVVYLSFGIAFVIGYGILGRYQNMTLFEFFRRKYGRPSKRVNLCADGPDVRERMKNEKTGKKQRH